MLNIIIQSSIDYRGVNNKKKTHNQSSSEEVLFESVITMSYTGKLI